jgi:Tetracyclin repressor-like, C-terminal domain
MLQSPMAGVGLRGMPRQRGCSSPWRRGRRVMMRNGDIGQGEHVAMRTSAGRDERRGPRRRDRPLRTACANRRGGVGRKTWRQPGVYLSMVRVPRGSRGPGSGQDRRVAGGVGARAGVRHGPSAAAEHVRSDQPWPGAVGGAALVLAGRDDRGTAAARFGRRAGAAGDGPDDPRAPWRRGDRRALSPAHDTETLAYAIVRLADAFLFNDAVADLRADVERLHEVQAALLGDR